MQGPKFVSFLGPVVEALKELGGSGRPAEVRDIVARKCEISEKAQSELLAGGALRFDNQVAWARFYLVKAGLIDSSKRGVWRLTEKGASIDKLTHKDALALFKEIHSKFISPSNEQAKKLEEIKENEIIPDETPYSNEYRPKLLNILKNLPAKGFERFCQRLLRESGFEQVTVTGRSGDGGIDGIGILQVNPLVSFKVLFQCKKYNGTVGPSNVRDFRGAMQGRADKGIIITTGTFTTEARNEAVRDGVPPIELVNGEKIIDMLEALELGLKPVTTYIIDEDFFEEFNRH